MITPENKVPLDDFDNDDADDQQSQQDIHSNGFEAHIDDSADDIEANTDLLDQAFDASEASFTLDADKGFAPKKGDDDSNVKS